MIAVGGLYIGKQGRRYLGIYNYQHDIYALPHPSLRDSTRLGHFTYLRGGRKGGVDVFVLNDSCPDPSAVMDIKKVFRLDGKGVRVRKKDSKKEDRINAAQLRRAGEHYGIQAEIIQSLPRTIRDEALTFEKADIAYFCGEEVATKDRAYEINLVSEIVPKTTLETMTPESLITGGKQWTVKECCFEGNRDYGKGCRTAWIPDENAQFDGKTFTNWFWDPWGECGYPCYAERQHKCPPKTVYEWDEERFRYELLGGCRLDFGRTKELGRPVDILRFGKRTEVWAPWSSEHFTRELEIIAELRKQGKIQTRGIITTRFIPYEDKFASLVRKTQSSMLYGIGFPEWEIGAYRSGATNEFRLEQAIKFRENRVNSNLYLLIIAHQAPTEREIKILTETRYGQIVPIQLLPLRFKWKQRTLEITGQTWDHLKGRAKRDRANGLLDFRDDYESYISENSQLVVKKIHPFWLDLVRKNQGRIRMCHHDDRRLFCGGCHIRPGFIKENRILPEE